MLDLLGRFDVALLRRACQFLNWQGEVIAICDFHLQPPSPTKDIARTMFHGYPLTGFNCK